MAQVQLSEIPARPLDDEEAVGVHELMATARAIETAMARVYAEGKLPGWIHSCEGHESFGAAVKICLSDVDHLVPHYRSRPEQLGKGMTVREMLAEVFGTVDAASKGRGGETHVSSISRRIYGMTGVLGSNIPLATGVAYASKMRGVDEVTVCSFGDGTANRGTFHEALNMASIWQLPVVFVCENNTYAEMSKISDFISVDSIAERASSYGMPGWVIDGHDPEKVIDALAHAVDLAHQGQPSLIEVKTIRRRGHWEGDPQGYREEFELASLDENDAVPTFRQRLIDDRGIDEERLAVIDSAALQVVDDALEFAGNGMLPTFDDVTSDVYEEPSDG